MATNGDLPAGVPEDIQAQEERSRTRASWDSEESGGGGDWLLAPPEGPRVVREVAEVHRRAVAGGVVMVLGAVAAGVAWSWPAALGPGDPPVFVGGWVALGLGGLLVGLELRSTPKARERQEEEDF